MMVPDYDLIAEIIFLSDGKITLFLKELELNFKILINNL